MQLTTKAAAISSAVVIMAALMAGCSSDEVTTEDRAAEAPSTESALDETAVGGSSQATWISVENQVQLPDGSPATLTWKVSNTQNSFWDGNSRPDHAPPQGFQGLVQESGSGAYRARAEVADNSFTKKPVFLLTPSINVDGDIVTLEPLQLIYDGSSGWSMELEKQTVWGCATSKAYSAQTSRGELTYQITGKCPSLEPSFVITSLVQ